MPYLKTKTARKLYPLPPHKPTWLKFKSTPSPGTKPSFFRLLVLIINPKLICQFWNDKYFPCFGFFLQLIRFKCLSTLLSCQASNWRANSIIKRSPLTFKQNWSVSSHAMISITASHNKNPKIHGIYGEKRRGGVPLKIFGPVIVGNLILLAFLELFVSSNDRYIYLRSRLFMWPNSANPAKRPTGTKPCTFNLQTNLISFI